MVASGTLIATCQRCNGRLFPEEGHALFCPVCGYREYLRAEYDADRNGWTMVRGFVPEPKPEPEPKPLPVPEPEPIFEPEHPESERIRELERELEPLTARVKVLRSELKKLKRRVYHREWRRDNEEYHAQQKAYGKKWFAERPGYYTAAQKRERAKMKAEREAQVQARQIELAECQVCHGAGKVKCLVCGSAG